MFRSLSFCFLHCEKRNTNTNNTNTNTKTKETLTLTLKLFKTPEMKSVLVLVLTPRFSII
jgi:hypothetical protein